MNKFEVFDRFDLPKVIAEATAECLKGTGGAALKYVLEQVGHPFIGAIAGEIGKGIIGPFALALLKGLLKVTDATSENVRAMINEPFETATRVGLMALQLNPKSKEAERSRLSQLQTVRYELERAYTLSKKSKNVVADRFQIRLLLGLVAIEQGDLQSARIYFAECIPVVESDYEKLIHQVESSRETASRQSQEFEVIKCRSAHDYFDLAIVSKDAGMTRSELAEEVYRHLFAQAEKKATDSKVALTLDEERLKEMRLLKYFLSNI